MQQAVGCSKIAADHQLIDQLVLIISKLPDDLAFDVDAEFMVRSALSAAHLVSKAEPRLYVDTRTGLEAAAEL